MVLQRTIKDDVEISGIGLHSGEFCKIILKPAVEDTGVIFIRADLPDRPVIKAEWKNVVHSELCTLLSKDGVSVSTVEHLLAAVRGLHLDNIIVEVFGSEIPILDGSAKKIVEAIDAVGFTTQKKARTYIQVLKPISVAFQDRFVYLLPSTEFKITCRINFSHQTIGLQDFEYKDNPSFFANEICRAKTFGLLEQVEELRNNGFIKGGNYDNAIVLNSEGVVNKDLMTFEDEFVRHKVLDIIGDMALCGSHYLLAHVVAYKSGHTLHSSCLKELGKRSSSFKIVEEPKPVDEKSFGLEVFKLLEPNPSK